MNYTNSLGLLSSRRFRLRDEHKYPHMVELDRHPDQPAGSDYGDPRKVWCYDCASAAWAVEADVFSAKRAYYFTSEQDALMFKLRWIGS